ncbi:hypothetical protein JTE90_011184 [Oedothorax gibbosus]|uniref:Cytochrome P450 n=1 Tax=Oedothorax gibbosus TaxID=931172 RepID=A0AAV6VZE4_9ARAC|nr:hypothetical protein JTE90_011184 [Oedothorax gibbosus]
MKVPTILFLRFSSTVDLLGKTSTQFVSPSLTSSRNQSTFAVDSAEALDRARSFNEIPGPKAFPLMGNLFRYLPLVGEYSKSEWHESQLKKFERYGPIVREEIAPGYYMVHLFDPKDMEVVSRNEGKNPKRDFFVAMRMMRESNPEVYSTAGVAAANGEDWFHIRRRSQKPMLRPDIMKTYLPQMNVIADDLIRRVRLLRQPNHQVPGLIEELFKWALESVNYILFNERMGCLDDDISPDSLSQQYIQAVNQFFQLSGKVELSSLPIWRAYPALSPSYQKLKKVHDFFFEHAMSYVKNKIDEAEKNGGMEVEDPSKLSLMEMLLRHGSPRDASVMAVDALAAGIDTTSLTSAYVLRNLAANPRVQKKLQEEVDKNVPRGTALTVQALDNMHYLKACVKESMRINPTVQGTSRTLDKDIVVSGYRIPANTLFTLNYNVSSVQESHFPNAREYIPERWLKNESGSNTSSGETFAFVPFGFGPRMCIGRRIAELEMFTLLTKIMQNFWIQIIGLNVWKNENYCTTIKVQRKQ